MSETNMYAKGKIYKIVNDVNDDIYIGSTCKALSNRMACHRSNVKIMTKKCKLYEAMRSLGINHFSIILIEKYSCECKDELRAREHHFITLLKPTLNTIGAVSNGKKFTDYYKDPVFRQRHLKRMMEYIECACGVKTARSHLSRHQKTKKHLRLMHEKVIVNKEIPVKNKKNKIA